MSVTISPVPGKPHIQVSGDIQAVLQVPFDDDDRFLVGISDCTLLVGTYDEQLRCSWSVAREGAAIVRIQGERVDLHWSVEWINVGLYNGAMIDRSELAPLPLFPELDRHAA
ncbi:hypothetical protein [Blastomonas sp.]|uniref:hypothetical protein n=1 Tax=Blastomonas sp. TaxID=1909299 RepID=UPI002610CDD0|nr:hypothetical protein [Blastomonas sp.]MDM7957028.1 hypothetical protein [Blastomonas sp.]